MASRHENGAPSARAVLEVAEGLRWTDPQLGASLAEHALRLAGDDVAVRGAAERAVVRSLAEVDRPEAVVRRAGPQLAEARRRGDRETTADLLVELGSAAVALDDLESAEALVAAVRGPGLSARTLGGACLVRAGVAAARGDVAAVEAAAAEASSAVAQLSGPEAELLGRDLTRARATGRVRAGDAPGAMALLDAAVTPDPAAEPDGGRRTLAATELAVDVLVGLGQVDTACARAQAVLPAGAASGALARAGGRVRVALAAAHARVGRHSAAEAVARSAAGELEPGGHHDDAARAWQVVAAAAEARGDLAAALGAVRHAHSLEARSREAQHTARRELGTAASAVELPPASVVNGPGSPPASSFGTSVPPPPAVDIPEDADPVVVASPPAIPALAQLAPDGVPGRTASNGEAPLSRRARRLAAEAELSTPRPDDLADPSSETASSDADHPGTALTAPATSPTAASDRPGSAAGLEPVGSGQSARAVRSTSDAAAPAGGRRSRHAAESASGAVRQPVGRRAERRDRPGPPTFDAFSTAPTRRSDGFEDLLGPRSSRSRAASDAGSAPGGAEDTSRPPVDEDSTLAGLLRDRGRPGHDEGGPPEADSRGRIGGGRQDDEASVGTDRSTPPREDTRPDDRRDADRGEDDRPGAGRREDGSRGAGRTEDGRRDADRWSDESRGDDRRDTDRRESGRRDAEGRGHDHRDSDRRESGRRDAEGRSDGRRDPESRENGSRPGERRDDGRGEQARRERVGGDGERSADRPDDRGRDRIRTDEDRSEVRRGDPGPIGTRRDDGIGEDDGGTPSRETDRAPVDDRFGPVGGRRAGPAATRRDAEEPAPREDRDEWRTTYDRDPNRRADTDRTTADRGRYDDPSRGRDGGVTPAPGSDVPDDFDDELPLTLASLLAEYDLPDVPLPGRRSGGGPGVAVPAARRHTSGSMPVPEDTHRSGSWGAAARSNGVDGSRPPGDRLPPGPGAAGRGGGAPTNAGPPGEGRPGRRPENGARLADLLAEAMDAFRHTGPGDGAGRNGPGVGSRRS